MRRMPLFLILGSLAAPVSAQQHITTTEAKSPAEGLATFKVPPGDTVQLVAAETDPALKGQLHLLAAGLFLDHRNLAAAMTELQLGLIAKPHESFHAPAAECYARAMTLTEDAQDQERE